MHYKIFAQDIEIEGRIFRSFGIRALSADNGIITQIPDVSADFAALNRLVRMMNIEKCELVHLKDIIEDFLH